MKGEREMTQRITEIEVHHWKILIKGGGLNYTEEGTVLHAFSIRIIFDTRLSLSDIPPLLIGNAKGHFDSAGNFRLEPWVKQRLLSELLARDAIDVYDDNPDLIAEITSLSPETWSGITTWFDYQTYLTLGPLPGVSTLGFYERELLKIVHYLAMKIEEALAREVW